MLGETLGPRRYGLIVCIKRIGKLVLPGKLRTNASLMFVTARADGKWFRSSRSCLAQVARDQHMFCFCLEQRSPYLLQVAGSQTDDGEPSFLSRPQASVLVLGDQPGMKDMPTACPRPVLTPPAPSSNNQARGVVTLDAILPVPIWSRSANPHPAPSRPNYPDKCRAAAAQSSSWCCKAPAHIQTLAGTGS